MRYFVTKHHKAFAAVFSLFFLTCCSHQLNEDKAYSELQIVERKMGRKFTKEERTAYIDFRTEFLDKDTSQKINKVMLSDNAERKTNIQSLRIMALGNSERCHEENQKLKNILSKCLKKLAQQTPHMSASESLRGFLQLTVKPSYNFEIFLLNPEFETEKTYKELENSLINFYKDQQKYYTEYESTI